jgi:hypothetical protein
MDDAQQILADLDEMNGYDARLDLGQRIDRARLAAVQWQEIATRTGLTIDGCRKARAAYLAAVARTSSE